MQVYQRLLFLYVKAFKRGVQWSDRGGGGQYISVPRTTNLAYLDAKK